MNETVAVRPDDIYLRHSIRMAICLTEGDRYVGNIYVTEIDWEKKFGFGGIFIGETSLWGRKIGLLAWDVIARDGEMASVEWRADAHDVES